MESWKYYIESYICKNYSHSLMLVSLVVRTDWLNNWYCIKFLHVKIGQLDRSIGQLSYKGRDTVAYANGGIGCNIVTSYPTMGITMW